jgi:hypothetical protein
MSDGISLAYRGMKRPKVVRTLEAELLEALEGLYEISGEATIPFDTSHGVRRMGKFMRARDIAKAAIDRAKKERTQ